MGPDCVLSYGTEPCLVYWIELNILAHDAIAGDRPRKRISTKKSKPGIGEMLATDLTDNTIDTNSFIVPLLRNENERYVDCVKAWKKADVVLTCKKSSRCEVCAM